MSNVKGTRVVGYVRVSRVGDRAGDSFLSPALQREAVERLAEREGLEIIEWIEELDASGGRPLPARLEPGDRDRRVRSRARHRGLEPEPLLPVAPRLPQRRRADRGRRRAAVFSDGAARRRPRGTDDGQRPGQRRPNGARTGRGGIPCGPAVGGRARHPRQRAHPPRISARRGPTAGARPRHGPGRPGRLRAQGEGLVARGARPVGARAGRRGLLVHGRPVGAREPRVPRGGARPGRSSRARTRRLLPGPCSRAARGGASSRSGAASSRAASCSRASPGARGAGPGSGSAPAATAGLSTGAEGTAARRVGTPQRPRSTPSS